MSRRGAICTITGCFCDAGTAVARIKLYPFCGSILSQIILFLQEVSLHFPELQSRKLLVAMSGESAGYDYAMQDVASARLSAMYPASCFRETY